MAILRAKNQYGEWGEVPAIVGPPGKNGTSVEITRITESGESGGSNTVEFSDGNTLTVKNGKDGKDGAAGKDGSPGSPGKDGDDYVLTEADKQEIAEMAAELVDVPGGGETPGVDGEDGGYYTPTVTQLNANTMQVTFSPSKSDMPSVAAKDISLPSGSPGADGDDGVSPTLSVSKSGKVTTITIKDANGTKTAQINDGNDGDPGQDGKDGVGISTIKQTTTSAEDGGSNVFTVTLTNGQTATFTVKNGSKGSQGNPGKDGSPGADGSDGYTPVRGTDYWTDADKAEIKSYVDEAILGGAW